MGPCKEEETIMFDQRWGYGRRSVSVLGCAYSLGLAACAGQTPDESLATTHDDLTAASANEAALSSGAGCDALLGQLQSQLLAQVSERAEQARISAQVYYGGGVFVDDVVPEFSGSLPSPPVVSAPLSSAPVLSAPLSSGPVASASIANELAASAPASRLATPSVGFSRTTGQVPGVDEGDFVKGEGDNIYLLQGQSVFVLDATPADSTSILTSAAIEGEPIELLVRGNQLVVFSYVYGPLPGEEIYSPYYYYYPTYTKLTVFDATGGTLQVQRESYVEGNLNASRRSQSVVRAVVQQTSKAQLDYPNVSYVDIFGRPRSQAEIDLQVDLWALLATESIEDSLIEDYLPTAYERVAGELVEQPLRCADYLVPGPGLTQVGSTSVIALDLDAVAAPLASTTLLGYSDYVYVDADAAVLRQTDYGSYTGDVTTFPTVKTNIHLFDLDGVNTTYVASGSVSGYVQNQYGLDEQAGVIRAVVTEEQYGPAPEDAGGGYSYLGTANQVVTLGTEGSSLTELGRTPAIASVDEYLYGASLVGDRAYLFTSGTANELTVVDLSDPAAPTVAGQLTTPDYTSLILPLPGDYLLGFGQTTDPTGSTQSVALQLFDVRDASAPSLAREFVYAESGYTEASYNARSVSFHPNQNVFAFPYQSYVTNASSLEVFRLSPSAGFERIGGVVPPAIEPTLIECLALSGYPTDPEFVAQVEQDPSFVASILEQCSYYTQPTVRRGLLRGNDVFSINNLSVAAYALDGLAEPPLSQVDLPYSPYYYYPLYASAPIRE
jgi:beta propeller domain-containing protein